MTINESFKLLISQIQPSPTELAAARQHLDAIKTRLQTVFQISDFRNTGSFARDTSISGFSDSDLIAVFRKVEFTWGGNLINSNTALDNVRKALIERYPNSNIRRDGMAIAIAFSDGRHVDVIPALLARLQAARAQAHP